MNRIFFITIIITSLVIFYSCNELPNNIDNSSKIILKKVILSKEDSLQYISLDTFYISARFNQETGANLVLKNNSEDITINIYDLKSDSIKIDVIPPTQFPVIIQPKQTNNKLIN